MYVFCNTWTWKKSGYEDIVTSNNITKLKSMYKDFEDTIGTNAKTFNQLSNGLKELTDYKLGKYFVGDYYTTKSNYIKNNNLPCISLRTGAIGKGWEWHYRVIIGTKTVANNTKVTAFGKTLLNFKTYDNYYIMHDNGTDVKTDKEKQDGFFFEKSNRLYQIRSAYVTKE